MNKKLKQYGIILRMTIVLALAMTGGALAQKTLTIDRPSDPSSLDPHYELTAPGSWVYSQIIETLVTLNPQMEIEPRLAENWEVVEPTRVRFYLRQDVDFHDGTHFDAHAVKYVWDRGTLGDPPARWIAFTGLINGVEVVDDYTIDITTSEPDGSLLFTLTPPYMGIPSPASIESLGADFGRNPVGTGPFEFSEWRSNERIVLTANEDYWRGRPALDEIVFRTVPEESSRMLALRAGETDMVILPNPSELESLAQTPNFWVEGAPGVGVFTMNFNLNMPFVNDARVRYAIAHAIDRELLVEAVLEGGGVSAPSVIGEAIFGFTDMELDTRYAYDPERAVALLEEAGFTRGADGWMYDEDGQQLSLNFLASNGRALKDREIAEVLQGFLGDVGIEVQIDLFEWATTSSILREAEIPYHITTSAFYTANGDADFALFPNFHGESLPPTGWNRSGYNDEEVNAWIMEARASLDSAERLELYAAVQERLAEDLPALPLYTTLEVAALSERVTGFVAHPVNYLLELYPVDIR